MQKCLHCIGTPVSFAQKCPTPYHKDAPRMNEARLPKLAQWLPME